ncbi:helix-turn-helix domain-containing protein [Mycobacterium canetti]|uniref:DNA binding protein n=1 Tax=Mycobacterium canettii (strain CIPT 140010059) TaxID=1048245 RepID=A0AB72XIH3_MYCCP|nr:helix-turn-helix transcriptional regulator [Mycobacterium canetti]MBA2787467.1 helix-turn-helix transcriptional regulator [Mycobacterium canetti]CCC43388.1 putative DNA binding protein [Mycobacterium canettii CIPT 140010059]
MAGKKLELGRTGRVVADNVFRLRDAAGLNYTELSNRLAKYERDIPPLAVRRIEEGNRRVDVDDLVGLALALDVSPSTLLMAKSKTGDDSVAVTGADSGVEARRLWRWLVAKRPLIGDPDGAAVFEFLTRAVPGWLLGGAEDDRYDLVESGVEPYLTRSVRTYGSEEKIRERADGDD